MHDLVIRGGTVVDGTGASRRSADVAVSDGLITEVGVVEGAAKHEIDADGALVTPGFVDIHTHYDGQITWDPLLTPSCWHGVTTVVMGNCGVGFAPVSTDRHDWLIGLMEGVEDIPGAALADGIRWEWETFPEFLDAIDRVPKAIDVGTQVPHGAVRAFVMGERGALNEPANSEDIKAMAEIVREGIRAGALGFSTSRTLAHRAISGEPVPGTFAAEDELFGIGSVLGELATGVFELAPAGALGEDLDAPVNEMSWMRRLSAAIRRPVTFALNQNNNAPEAYRLLLQLAGEAKADGVAVRPQVHGRTVSLLLGLQTFHAFNFAPSWGQIALLPWAEQALAMRDPALRERFLAEADVLENDPIVSGFAHPTRTYVLGDPPDYEPAQSSSISALAGAAGRSAWEELYDRLLEDEGRQLLNAPVLNYSYGNLDAVREMLVHPSTVFGLGDGGAHCGQTCDASTTTFLLSYWARDRKLDRIPLEEAVRKLTSATADTFGLSDRGRLVAGKRADINVIDFENLGLERPFLVSDLPGGAKRLIQHSTGYLATINAGQVTIDHGQDTGARPGALVRGSR